MEGLHIIGDHNFEEFTRPEGFGFIEGQLDIPLPMFATTYGRIPRSEWKGLIEQGKGAWLSDLIIAAKVPSKDQNGLGYCWIYASAATVETMRVVQNQPYVMLCPESAGGPITGWRNRGGYGAEALKQLTEKGIAPASYCIDPHKLNPRLWKQGWEDECSKYKINDSWFQLQNFDDVMSALLMRMPVSIGLNWWGHQVMLTDPVLLDNGGFGAKMRNSWGEDWPSKGAGGWSILTESRLQPSSSFAAGSVGKYGAPRSGMSPIHHVMEGHDLVRKRIAGLRSSQE